jgi:hypothetical protein
VAVAGRWSVGQFVVCTRVVVLMDEFVVCRRALLV